MFDPGKFLINNCEYELPAGKIADFPVIERDRSKLLIYNDKNICEDLFFNLADYLESSDLLVFNNTKVINARILFPKETGSVIEVFCLEPLIPSDYYSAFKQKNKCTWKCIVGNLKKWKNEFLEKTYFINSGGYSLTAKMVDNKRSYQVVEFRWDSDHNFEELIRLTGIIPLPPYIKRNAETLDYEKYQTVYSKLPGSVAAPTAGLHFTEKVFNDLKDKKIEKAELTLHIGAGTFKPLSSENIAGHVMHREHISIDIDALEKISDHRDQIVTVGTTSLRALESIYWLGVKIVSGMTGPGLSCIEQWDGFQLEQEVDFRRSVNTLIEYMKMNNSLNLDLSTSLMILPGYRFRSASKLITNFHMPGSTLLLLVAAFIGDGWRSVYDYALNNNFRFLSYGDCSLLVSGHE